MNEPGASMAQHLKINALFVLAALALSGCAGYSLPAVPDFVLNQGARIGVLVETGNHPHHTHIGVTAIGTSRKVYPYTWDLEAIIKSHFIRRLESEGFVALDLTSLGMRYAALDGLIGHKEGRWLVPPQKQEMVRALADQHQLQAIVLVKEKNVVAEVIGQDYYGRDLWNGVNGSGVYSTMGLGGIKYKAIAGVEVQVYTLGPLADLNLFFPMASSHQWRLRSRPIQELIAPKNRIMITEQEFEKALPVIEKCIVDLADLAICSLKRQAENFPLCYNEIIDRQKP